MRYYVTADPHGFYTLLQGALASAGYFDDAQPHTLVILGDAFDRGREALQMQAFLLERMDAGGLILVRGNHEDLFCQLLDEDGGLPTRQHLHNGTYDTALQLTGLTPVYARLHRRTLIRQARQTPYYTRIIPASVDYYETAHYIFVHGWVPCVQEDGVLRLDSGWRCAEAEDWKRARWLHGIDAVRTARTEKTVLCGHWHTSYGHAVYEKSGPEFGPGADFSPYRAPGILALDACTALSGRINVAVLEDEPDTKNHTPV